MPMSAKPPTGTRIAIVTMIFGISVSGRSARQRKRMGMHRRTVSTALRISNTPNSLSCEVRTLPPDTSEYVEQMRQFQKSEESENCRAEIEDNIEKIGLGIASESIRHRFFLVFQYEAKMRAKRNTVKGIIQRLNEEADTARRYLDICELEVLEPRYTDDFVLKLLYELINKGTSLRVKLPEGVFDMTTEVHGVYEE